jgi:hypothetical protein
MIRGLCASKAPWYNVSLASSLFPSQLPPLPKHAISEYVGLAYIREDRDFAFDGGSSACATIAAVCLMFVFKLMIFWSFHSYNLQNSFARLLGFTCMPCETKCGQQYFSVTMAVAGILSFSIVAQFDDDTVIIGCEHQQDAQAIARALGIHQFNSLNVLEPVPGRVQEWRVVSWFTRCNASLTSFTICACSTSGFEVKMGWIGAITVGQDVPVSVAAAPADHNCISARACASRKVMSFANAPGDEVCDIQCLWTRPSNQFFPFVDVYVESIPRHNGPDNALGFGGFVEETDVESLCWRGRSTSGVFVITNACLSLPQRIVLMGMNSMLQRVVLARIDIRVPWIESQHANE